ncbi:hypothetical protein [Beijerinckia mobilis]|uniref:hypothetical protein n=1 Tax=Beijerinckia mobilis TaxID=231434 RepID=UPI003521165F
MRVRFDQNKYSVGAAAIGQPVEIYASLASLLSLRPFCRITDRIMVRRDRRALGGALGRALGEVAHGNNGKDVFSNYFLPIHNLRISLLCAQIHTFQASRSFSSR